MARLISLGLLVILSVALVQIHYQARNHHTLNTGIGFSSIDQHPAALGAGQWHFAFTDIEQILATMVRATGAVDVNYASLEKLQIIDSIINRDSDFPWNRLQFLIEKSFSSSASSQLYDLVERYSQYQAALKAMDDNKQVTNVTLDQKIELQRQLFDAATAQALFSQSNATTSYLLQRKAVMTDTSLNAKQRKALLDDLNRRFADSFKKGND